MPTPNDTINPHVGAAAPDFEACDTSGRVVKVSDYWRDGPLVLVFMRHLGCPFCRAQVASLRDRYAEFEAAGAQVACVAMGGDKVGRAFQIMFALPYPLLMIDESDSSPYRSYGLERGDFLQMFGPRVLTQYLSTIITLGRHSGSLSSPGDKLQMPGAFVIEQGGTVRLAYRSKDAGDNAPIDLLLSTLEQMRSSAV